MKHAKGYRTQTAINQHVTMQNATCGVALISYLLPAAGKPGNFWEIACFVHVCMFAMVPNTVQPCLDRVRNLDAATDIIDFYGNPPSKHNAMTLGHVRTCWQVLRHV